MAQAEFLRQLLNLPNLTDTGIVSGEAVVFVDDAFRGDIQDAIAGAFNLVITLDAGEIFGDEFADGRIIFYVGLGDWNSLVLLDCAFLTSAFRTRINSGSKLAA